MPTLSGYYSVVGIDINGCSSEDSTLLDFYSVISVNYEELITSVDISASAFNVTGGIPTGGIYSGPGIIGTSFHPGLAGIGLHPIVYSVLNNNGCYSRDTSYIEVTNINSLNDLTNNIHIYPNPTSSTINIVANDSFQYFLISQDGKEIINGSFYLGSNQLDLRNLNTGLYLLKMINNHLVYSINISKIDKE